jgi:hypothetical protein
LIQIGPIVRYTNTVTFPLACGSHHLFVKIKSAADARADERGHAALQTVFPVPRIYARIPLGPYRALIMQRWGGSAPENTLLDLLNRRDLTAVGSFMHEFCNRVRHTILATAELRPRAILQQDLYEARLRPGGRIDHYYAEGSIAVDGSTRRIPLENLRSWTIRYQGSEYVLDWMQLLASLRSWAVTAGPVWSAMLHGDPTDLNIAVPFGWFDYSTAGLNAIMGEFANFAWSQFLLGGYLAPRYDPAAYADRPLTFLEIAANTPEIRVTADYSQSVLTVSARHHLARSRRFALQLYFRHLVHPVTRALGFRGELDDLIRPYLLLRMIGVYNLQGLEPHDTVYLLCLIAHCASPLFRLAEFLSGAHDE